MALGKAGRDLPELAETIEGFPMTEDGVARAFAAAHADRLRFCHSSGRWHVWTGTHWRKEETKLAFNWVREICRARSASDPLSSAAKALAKAATAAAVERFAQADRAFAVTAAAWDSDHWLLGTPGGTVDLRTGQLVTDGRMPKPLRIDARLVWDVRQLDSAIDALHDADSEINSWSDL